MKAKAFSTKLVLKKQSVSNLTDQEQKDVVGGNSGTCGCAPYTYTCTWIVCPTDNCPTHPVSCRYCPE